MITPQFLHHLQNGFIIKVLIFLRLVKYAWAVISQSTLYFMIDLECGRRFLFNESF